MNIIKMDSGRECDVTHEGGADKICISEECTLSNPFVCGQCEESHEHNGTILAVRINKIKQTQGRMKQKLERAKGLQLRIEEMKSNFERTISHWAQEIKEQMDVVADLDSKIEQLWTDRQPFHSTWRQMQAASKVLDDDAPLNEREANINNMEIALGQLVGPKQTAEEESAKPNQFFKDFTSIFSYLPIQLSSNLRNEIVEQIRKLEPNDVIESKCQGRLYEIAGENDKALSVYSALLEKNSLNSEVLNRRAILLKNMGRLEEAEEDYSLLIGLLDGKISLNLYYFQRAEILRERGEYSRALKDYKVSEGGNNKIQDLHKMMGHCYFKLGNLEEARAQYELALQEEGDKKNSSSLELLQLLLECCKATKKTDRCLEYLNKIESISPGNVSILLQRAALHHASGEYAKSYDDYTRVLEQVADNANIYYNRAVAALYTKKAVEAVEDLRKATRLDPNFKEAANLLANTAYELSQGAERAKYLPIAVEAHIHCTKLIPDGEGIWHNLGLLYSEDEHQKAYDSFSKALEINPSQAASYLGRIKVSLKLSRPAAETLTDIYKVIKLGNRSAHIFFIKSVMEEQLGELQEALKTLKLILDADPERVGALESRVRILDKLGREEEAAEDKARLAKLGESGVGQQRKDS